MRLLAGLAAGVFAYLVIGAVLGVRPRLAPRPATGRSRSQRRREWLHQAGAQVSPAQFLAASVAGGSVALVALWAVTGVLPLALVAGGATSLWPRAYYARRRRQAHRDRIAAWPDALRDLVAHLRAPLSVHASLVELSRSGPLPLRPYFARYTTLSAALDHRRALEVVREELADPLSDRIVEVILVAFDQGSGTVIDVLGDLADATTADLRLHEEIETAQLETRLEARGAAVLPFAVLVLLCATSPEYRTFYTQPAGWLVIAAGGAMCLVGLVVISRLGRVPTEERILAGGGTAP